MISADIFKRRSPPKSTSQYMAGVILAYHSACRELLLQWDRTKKQLILFGTIEFDNRLWATNGRVTSIVDLYGEQILLFSPYSVDLPGYLLRSANEMLKDVSKSINAKTAKPGKRG